MEEKIKTLLENNEFAAKLADCRDIASAKTLLAEYGVELTEGMLKQLTGGELSDDELVGVAGGSWKSFKAWMLKKLLTEER